VTRDLLGDAGVTLVDRGEHVLKGLERARRLYALRDG
jgi:hypothetical protein